MSNCFCFFRERKALFTQAHSPAAKIRPETAVRCPMKQKRTGYRVQLSTRSCGLPCERGFSSTKCQRDFQNHVVVVRSFFGRIYVPLRRKMRQKPCRWSREFRTGCECTASGSLCTGSARTRRGKTRAFCKFSPIRCTQFTVHRRAVSSRKFHSELEINSVKMKLCFVVLCTTLATRCQPS